MSGDDARQREEDLQQIRFHWGRSYEVGWQDGSFWFRRRDNGTTLQCLTAMALWAEIRLDYSARPVDRPSGRGVL